MQKAITAKPAQLISEKTQRRATFMALDAVFFGAAVLLSQQAVAIPLHMLPLFALATMRLAHTISYNEILEWLREPFCVVEKDSCGAGENVHPKGTGSRYVFGALLACPICSGTWAALFLYATWVLYEPLGRTLVYVLAFAGASELLHYVKEACEWVGRMTRVVSGAISPDK